MRLVLSVSKVANRTGNEQFLDPLIGTAPERRPPPLMRNLSIDDNYKEPNLVKQSRNSYTHQNSFNTILAKSSSNLLVFRK